MVQRTTSPPARCGEGELIEAIENAWRFLPDGPERERLKEAKGVGTPATRNVVIDGLTGQGLLVATGGKLRPMEVGM